MDTQYDTVRRFPLVRVSDPGISAGSRGWKNSKPDPKKRSKKISCHRFIFHLCILKHIFQSRDQIILFSTISLNIGKNNLGWNESDWLPFFVGFGFEFIWGIGSGFNCSWTLIPILVSSGQSHSWSETLSEVYFFKEWY